MQELVPEDLISQIFNLKLSNRLIADSKASFPFFIGETIGKNTYKILLNTGEHNLAAYDHFFVELKGKVDIEYLRYVGEANLEAIIGEPDYYRMKVTKLYKVNKRKYRRVPYRRVLNLVSPIECEALLENISASGAMFKCPSKLEGDTVTMGFTLFKKNVVLRGDIVDQNYDEEEDCYRVRCHFNPIDATTKKLILKAVKNITLQAKERLRRR